MVDSMVKVGLALSDGGIKGMGHIGAIKVLEKNKIPIDLIVGTSAGALIGGIYASGTDIKKIEKTFAEMNIKDVVKLVDPTRPRVGLVKGGKLMRIVDSLLKEKKIENFKIPFAAIATNVITGEQVIFKEGNASLAIRSSISIPGVFTPVKYKGMLLADGGVVNPLPVDVAVSMGADVVIGVSVMPKPERIEETSMNILTNCYRIIRRRVASLVAKDVKNAIIVEMKMPSMNFLSDLLLVSAFKGSISKAIKIGERKMKKKLPEIRNFIDNYLDKK